MKLYVMRHSDWNNTSETILKATEKTGKFQDPPLNAEGRKRTKEMIPEIKKINPAIIFSSTTRRCIQTTTILTGRAGQDKNIHARTGHVVFLSELRAIDLPPADKLKELIRAEHTHFPKKWIDFWLDKNFDDGLEPIADYIKRTRAALEIIRRRFYLEFYNDEPILAVCHGETKNTLDHFFRGIPFAIAIKQPVDFCEIAEFEI